MKTFVTLSLSLNLLTIGWIVDMERDLKRNRRDDIGTQKFNDNRSRYIEEQLHLMKRHLEAHESLDTKPTTQTHKI